MKTDHLPVNCFAGMFDIIGFKALRLKKGTVGLHQQFVNGIAPAIQHSAAGRSKTVIRNEQSFSIPDFSDFSVRYKAISDTVIFYTKDDSFESFRSLIHSSCMLLRFGFSGGKAPFRGAIGWGDIIGNSDGILIGSAIEDAYEGEGMQAWAGGMLTRQCRDFILRNEYDKQYKEFHVLHAETIEDEFEKSNIIRSGHRLVEYIVPTQHNPKNGPVKYGTLKTYVIDWTIGVYEGAAEMSFEPSDNSHAQAIAKNTCVFENWVRKNNSPPLTRVSM